MFVSVAPRSLPLVLYPPKRMSVLQISVDAFSSQVFRLWMAEGANAKELPIYNQAHAGPQEWHTEEDGKILRSPHAHARILSINTSQAMKLPGVQRPWHPQIL